MMPSSRGPRHPSQQESLFEPDPIPALTSEETGAGAGRTRPDHVSEAKRSIRYMTNAVLTYGKVDGLSDLLDRVASLRQYKPYNALLILLQRPAATYVLPAHRWLEQYRRVVRPGEQPLVLLQYRGPVMFLFDVSQTEEGDGAKSLPLNLQNPYGMADAMHATEALTWVVENAKADGVRVTPAPLGQPFAGCIQRTKATVSQRVTIRRRPREERDVAVVYDIELNRSYRPTEQLATIAHELGHLYCGHLGAHADGDWRDRRHVSEDFQELEAESVARVVFRTLAPEVQLPDHLSQFFAEEPDLADVDLEPVLTAAGRVLEMSQGFAPQRRRVGTGPG